MLSPTVVFGEFLFPPLFLFSDNLTWPFFLTCGLSMNDSFLSSAIDKSDNHDVQIFNGLYYKGLASLLDKSIYRLFLHQNHLYGYQVLHTIIHHIHPL